MHLPLKHAPHALLCWLATLLTESKACAQSMHDGFKPTQWAEYYEVALQPDGGIVAGGRLNTGGVTHPQLVKMLPNGEIDFTASLSSFLSPRSVFALCSLPDGSVLAGGGFSSWGGEYCSGFIKLRPDGHWDRSFVPPDTSFDWLSGDIHALPDGRVVYASGVFGNGYAQRLKADGSADPSWSPVGGYIQGRYVLPLPDGRMILAAGSIKRLLPNGEVDASFTIQPMFARALALQQDGKILVGGYFQDPVTFELTHLRRLHPDGTLDTAFTPDINGEVWEVEVQRDGRILIAGSFTQVEGQLQKYAARLNPDGNFDAEFRPQSWEWYYDFKERPDGVIVTAGALRAEGDVDFRTPLGLIHPDGTVDADWRWGPSGAVNAAAVQPDGLVVCGTSSSNSQEALVRLKKDGSPDSSLNCQGLSGEVHAVLVLADGDILVGGDFEIWQEVVRDNLARISPTGVLRPGFESNFHGKVKSMRLLPDQQILAAGEFIDSEGEPLNIARLHPDGSFDAGYIGSADGPIDVLSLLPDGRCYAAGRFTEYGGLPRAHLARLLSTGAADPAFAPTVNGTVNSVFAMEDGGCLICGDFTQVNGQARTGIARLRSDGSLDSTLNPSVSIRAGAIHQRPDGAVVVAGSAWIPIGGAANNGKWEPRLLILSGDGSLQIELMNNPEFSEGHVSMLTALPDGRLVLGGDFYFYSDDGGDLHRQNLARLSATPQTYQRLEVSASGRVMTWSRRLPATRVEEVVFELSDSSGNWLPLGPATRIGNSENWAMAGLNLPPGQRQIRARGRAPGGEGSWHQFTSWADIPAATSYGDWQEDRYGLRAGDALTAAWWAASEETGEENLLRYGLGGIAAFRLPQAVVGAGGVPAYCFPSDVGGVDVVVTVQAADTLTGPWTDIASRAGNAGFTSLVPGISLIHDAGKITLTETASASPLTSQRFYRLSLRLIAP
jgi:uncharacterized delta-60 repeat protein